MMYYTHLAIAFLFGLASIKLFHITNPVFFISIALIAGLFPDIDHPKSKLGKYFRPFSFLFEHRGFFHSFLMLPIISLVLFYFNHSEFSFPILIGYKSHLISDAFTKEGIMPLHPISRFRIKGFVKTGGFLEFVIFISSFVASGYFLL